MSRKQNRYFYYLIWLTISFHASTITAQSFEPIQVGESLTQEVSIGSVELSQWQSLQQAEVAILENDQTVQTYFENNFNVDGAYGELNSGVIVTDWNNVAKQMGTTGFALAGAYALWRRRRLQYLEKLRSGDSSAIDELFEEHFSSPNEGLNGSTVEQTYSIPQTNEAWESWAKERGVPGAGATLAALYTLWVKRRQQAKPTDQYYDDILEITSNAETNWSAFYQALALSNQEKYQDEVEIINEQHGLSVEETNQHNALKAQIQAEQTKLNILNSYRYYFSESDEARMREWQRTGSYYYGRNYGGYSQKLSRAGYNKDIFSLGKDIAAQQAVIDSLKSQETPFLDVIATKNKLVSTVSSKYQVLLSGAYSYWSTISQRAQVTQNWQEGLQNLSSQVSAWLETEAQRQEKTFKQNLKTVLSTFSAQDVEALKTDQFVFDQNPNFAMTIAQKEAEIEAQIAQLATKAEGEFQRQAAQVNAYNQNLLPTLEREAEARYPFGTALYNSDFEYVRKLRSAYVAEQQKIRALVLPDRNVIQQRYLVDHKAGLEASLLSYKTGKAAYDLRRALSQASDLDLTTPIEILIPLVEDLVPSLNQDLENLKQQKEQALARANAVVSNAYSAIEAQFRAQYPNDYNYWYVRQYVWPPFYESQIAGYQAQKDLQIKAANQQFDPLISQAYRDIEIAKTDYQKELEIRVQKVATLENLRAQAPDANRLLSFFNQLENVAPKSQFFTDKNTQTGDLMLYESAIASLKSNLNQGGDFANEIAEIKQQLSVSNTLTWDEHLDQNPADKAYLALNPETEWWSKDNWERQRFEIGYTYGQTWNKRYAELARSISTNYMGAADNPHLIAKLEEYAVNAHEEMLQSHTGWEQYYKEHPLIADARRDQLQARLDELQAAQNKEAAQLAAQIETLQAAQSETIDQLYATQKWLGSASEDRAKNALTDQIIEAEIATEPSQTISPSTLLDNLAWERKTQSLQSKIEVGEFAGPAVSWAMVANYDPKQDDQLQAKISRMHWLDTDSGKEHASNVFNAASRVFHEKRYEAYKTTNGVELSFNEYLRRATGVNGQSLDRVTMPESTPSTSSDPTINEYGEIDTRNTVELVEQYDGISSENPESIKAFKQYMAEKSLRESSENPTNIPASQTAAQAYSDAHSTPTLNPSSAVAEAEALLEGAQTDESPDPLPVIPPAPVVDETRLRDNVLNIDTEFVGESVLEGVITESDGVILDVVTAREKVGLFASALAESLQLAFPGEAIGQSIQAFMLNRSSGIQEIAEVRNRLQQKYPDEGYLINQLTVDDLLVSYPETKAILVDLGLIALELAGGAIARIGGKVIAPLKIPQVSKAVWYKAKGFSDELLRQAKLIVQQTRDAAAQALQNAKTGLDNLIEAGVNTVDDVTRLGDDLMRSLGIEPVPVQGSLNDIRRDHPVSYIDDVTSSLKNWFTKQADNSKDLFNSLINKFDDLKAKVGGSGTLIDHIKINDLIEETLNMQSAGNVTSKFTLNFDEVLEAAEKYLGKGYTTSGHSGYRSADGLRRFRMDQGSLDGQHGPKPGHVHFEIFDSIESNIPTTINHVIVSQ